MTETTNKFFQADGVNRRIIFDGADVSDIAMFAYMPEDEGTVGDGIVFTIYRTPLNGVLETTSNGDLILVARQGEVYWLTDEGQS